MRQTVTSRSKPLLSTCLTALTVLAVVIMASAGRAQVAQDYDLVILNGRVIDPETRLDAMRNVGVRNGRIEVVTEAEITGRETIDAGGLVVAPGFIDPHIHAFDPYSNRLLVRDGVTTALELELGAYPIEGFYDEKAGTWPLNYGAAAGHIWARATVMDGVDCKGTGVYSGCLEAALDDGANFINQRQATPEQIREIVTSVEEAERGGALGVAFPIGYYAAVGSDEVVAVAGVAARYGQFITSHVRYLSNVPPSGYLAVEEMIAVAALNNTPLLVQHTHSNCLAKTPQCLDMIDQARRRGLSVMGEFYPYEWGSTKAIADYLAPDKIGNIGIDYSDIIVPETGQTQTLESFTELRANAPTTMIIMHHVKEPDMLAAFRDQNTLMGSDANGFLLDDKPLATDAPYGEGRGHPRAAGSHARTLRFVREQNVVTLMEAVHKLSYGTAKWLEDMVPDMRHRGRIQAGAIADITIFDPETVTDNADFAPGTNSLPSTGIPYVIVNGTIVVRESRVQGGVFPGQSIRNPVID